MLLPARHVVNTADHRNHLMIVFSLFCAVGVRIKMASLLRLRSGRREWRGRRRDDLTQLTYEEHRTLSKVLHESLKTFKATLDYAEMDEESSMSDSDLSDESADTALSKLRQSQNEKNLMDDSIKSNIAVDNLCIFVHLCFFVENLLRSVKLLEKPCYMHIYVYGCGCSAIDDDSDFIPRGKGFSYLLRPVAADENKKSNAAVPSSSTNTSKPASSDHTEEDGRNSVSRYTYSLRRRNQVVEQSSGTKSSNINSDENVGQNHRISARSSVKKTKSRGEYASASKTEATATEMKTDATGMDGQTSSSQSKSFNVNHNNSELQLINSCLN
ncbi:ubiquitin-conjugating enzyme E22 [Trichinella spiralis]|uniref:ubiquitin-conjugating enzyme E22 n=1 Tax=Trichinella spiralis TaxID=6334 RepID=UPI0001EFEF2C|nr:ubiquitin-conjugating enzyme E22 [Trichinella spiralis]